MLPALGVGPQRAFRADHDLETSDPREVPKARRIPRGDYRTTVVSRRVVASGVKDETGLWVRRFGAEKPADFVRLDWVQANIVAHKKNVEQYTVFFAFLVFVSYTGFFKNTAIPSHVQVEQANPLEPPTSMLACTCPQVKPITWPVFLASRLATNRKTQQWSEQGVRGRGEGLRRVHK